MSYTIQKRLALIFLTLVTTYLASESLTGAPSSIFGYYFYDYDEVTTGVIKESRVIERGSRYSGAVYEILYEYEIDGNLFSSSKVNHSANYRTVAYTTVDRYPVSREVLVYYVPYKPYMSVLEKSAPGYWIWGQIASALIICFLATYYFLEWLLNR